MQTEIIKALIGSAGGSDKLYVDDLFSTYLYKGNATARSINNGIDLAGEGGLVWSKTRDLSQNILLCMIQKEVLLTNPNSSI